MLKPLLFVSLLFGFLCFQKESYKWQRIVPLVTKRSEVEALLGAPVRGSGYILTYETQDEGIMIWYGGAKTSQDDPCRWNIPSDTVFSFVVGPKKKMLVSDVKFDLKNFSKFKDPEIGDHFHYFDFQDGIRFSTWMTNGEEVIGSFSCAPNEVDTKKYCGQKQ
jgi:hypothetical protein